jgi:Flp pilus assembly pilin Flp
MIIVKQCGKRLTMNNHITAYFVRSARIASARLRTLCNSEQGQDLIEYALMAAAIAIAVAAIFPQTLAPNISTIFSKVNSTLGASNN